MILKCATLLLILKNFLKNHRFLLLLLLAGLIVRFFIFYQIKDTTPHPDFFAYKEWVYKTVSHGLSKTYSSVGNSEIIDVDQPPLTMYILRGSYEAFLLTARGLGFLFSFDASKALWINDVLLVLFLRLPSMISDIILGFLIYLFVNKKTNNKLALVASSLYLFNPAIIYNSTVWGQLDAINNLFFYISLLFLFQKKTFHSLFFLCTSLLTKLSLLPLLPVYLAAGIYGKYFKSRKIVTSIFSIFAIVMIFSIPLFSNPFLLFPFLLNATQGQFNAISVGAFNFWWVLFHPALKTSPPDAHSIYFGLSLSVWGFVLFGILALTILIKLFKLVKKKKLTEINIIFLLMLTIFAAFLFLPKMHERYLFPVLPLLVTWVALKNRHWIFYIFISILHFLNLYIIWNPDLFLFRGFESIVMQQATTVVLSVFTLAIFTFFLLKARGKNLFS